MKVFLISGRIPKRLSLLLQYTDNFMQHSTVMLRNLIIRMCVNIRDRDRFTGLYLTKKREVKCGEMSKNQETR